MKKDTPPRGKKKSMFPSPSFPFDERAIPDDDFLGIIPFLLGESQKEL